MKIIGRPEAKALGLKYYFTGKPCSRGHVCVRYVCTHGCFECIKINALAWKYLHLEEERKRNRAFKEANPGYFLAWQQLNREKCREYSRKHNKKHPEKSRARCRNRRAKKANAAGSHTAADIANLYQLQRGRCACGCREPLGKKYHTDHIVPLDLGGSNDKANLQLLRPGCNARKKNKHPLVFYREQGFLL